MAHISIRSGFSGTVGDTPLIRLQSLSAETGCNILGKAEFLNPGGSVKDRAALYIIRDAEQRGALKPGATVVEGTAGNTGIGLAHICAERGYRCIIVIPDNQSPEKMELLRHARRRSEAGRCQTLCQPRQLPEDRSTARSRAAQCHLGQSIRQRRRSAGPLRDDWARTMARYRRRNRRLRLCNRHWWHARGCGALSERAQWSRANRARGSAGKCALQLGEDGELKAEGSSITEGIGTTRITANLEGTPIDDAVSIDDQTCVTMVYRLLREEGLFLGGSSGINAAAAVQVARDLGPGHTVVTVLADRGGLYSQRLFNPDWLSKKGLSVS